MAEETKTTPVVKSSTTAAPPAIDWNKAVDKISKVKEALKEFVGKIGYNPFLYAEEKVRPLQDRYTKGERTPELFKAIMELPDKPDPNIKSRDFKPGLTSVVLDTRYQDSLNS